MYKFDDEATQYQNPDDEATRFEDTHYQQTKNDTTTSLSKEEVEVKSTKDSIWKRSAAGAGAGLLIGGVSTFLMGMKPAPGDDINSGDIKENNNHKEELSNPEWVDDDIAVATMVNDDMSFGEAFAAARTEVGPGGCFEWRGNVYGTYTADEWNNMTAEQRADWSDHFSWNHIDHSQSDVAQHSTTAQHTSSDATAQATANDDDIEVISVNHNENSDIAQNQQNNVYQTSNEVEVQSAEPEIEVLGVVHDSETNANIGGMTIDGQDVILIDVDNDLAFDYIVADVNGNGQIDQNELVDIREQNLNVNDLGGFSNPMGDLYAGNVGPDYSNDGVYEV